MSFLIDSFLLDLNVIVSVENPVALSTVNGTAFGSLVFQATVRCRLASGFYRDVPVSFAAGSYDGNTNGSYSLTGTITPDIGSVVKNPNNLTATIVVWVLPPPHFWIDWIDRARLTGGIDNIGRIITVNTGKVGATNAVAPTSELLRRPSFNGEGTYFNSQSVMQQSSAKSFFAPYHNGTHHTIYVVWKQLEMADGYFRPLYDSINSSSANKGIGLYVDNRITALSRTKRLVCFITTGAGAAAAVVSTDNAVVENAWNWASITYNGTSVVMRTNGSQVGTVSPGAFVAGDATNLLNFGNMFTVGTSTGIKGYLKHIYMEDSFMSSGDRTFLDSWATAMCQENLIVEPANVYLRIGQSNQAGRGANGDIAVELNGAVGAMIMVPSPTPATSTEGSGTIGSDSYWEELELTRNQTTEFVATLHGMEMRFGYEMWQTNESCWIVKYGIGGTPIYQTVTYNDWNVSSAQLYTQFYNLSVNALDELKHVFRKTPVIRGLSIMQGETDAIIVGADAVFKANWTTFINTYIGAIETYGYTIDKLRIFFWQISDAGGYAYDATRLANIKAAQADLGTNYLADNPSMVSKIRGVTYRTTDDVAFNTPSPEQHYSAAGLDMMGEIEYEYFKIWASE